MKRFSILFIIAMMFVGLYKSEATVPPPPTSSWALSATQGDYGTILLKPTIYGGVYTINGRAMAAGDAIGVFFYDGAVRKCAGYMIWQGTENTNNNVIVVWENDTLTTGIKEGFFPGEPLNYVMWDNVLQAEVPVISTVCNTTGIPTINYPAVGPCLTTFAGNMVFMFDSMVGQVLGVPTLAAPANLATNVSLTPTLSWSSVATATGYKVQVSTSNTFATLVKDLTVVDNTTDITSGLANGTTYYWRVRATRGTELGEWTSAWSFTTLAASGYTISGTLKYANTAQTAMNNCTINLKDASNNVVATVVTDATGAYSFTGVANGNYTVEITHSKAVGGLASIDALRTRQHISNVVTTITPFNTLRFKAADVVMNNNIQSTDVLQMRRKAANQTYSWTAPPYVYHPLTVTVTGANAGLNIQALCAGDVDGSFTPPAN